MRYRSTHSLSHFSLKALDSRNLETHYSYWEKKPNKQTNKPKKRKKTQPTKPSTNIKFIDLLECMVWSAVEISYVLAAWRAALLIKERNGTQLKRKQQGSLSKAFDIVFQEEKHVLKCAKYHKPWRSFVALDHNCMSKSQVAMVIIM